MRICHLLNQNKRSNLVNLFKSFDKVEFMRIDGRVRDGEFVLIELTPDAYLGDDCAVYEAFKHHGYSHSQMFKAMVENAQRS